MNTASFATPLHISLLFLTPSLPLVLAFMLAVPRLRRLITILAPLTALLAVATALLIQPGLELEFDWFFMGGRMGLDHLGSRFLLLSALVWFAASLYTTRYLQGDERRHHFWFFFLLSMSFNFGLILAQDMLGFYLFFALMSFSAYGLIVHRRTKEARQAGIVYIILVMVGEVLLFTGMTLLANKMANIELTTVAVTSPTSLSLSLILLSFAIKAGALPLHVWLPLAHPVAPVPASAVLSGVMIKAGLLGWLRFLPTGLDISMPDWAALFIIMGLLAAFYGVVIGLGQHDVKTVLAYSSISQMGLMTVMVGCGMMLPRLWPQVMAAISIYALHHGLAKGFLFLGVGIARQNMDSGIPRMMFWVGLVTACLALAGAPLTSGALAKHGIKSFTHELPGMWSTLLAFLLPCTAAATTLLLGHFLFLVHDLKKKQTVTPGPTMFLAWGLVLICLIVLSWIWSRQQRIDTELHSVIGIWQDAWPILVGGLLIWGLKKRGREFFSVPAGDILWFISGNNKMAALWKLVLFLRKGEPFLELRKLKLPLDELTSGSRQLEKILKRWAVVGLCYLSLCLLILVLLIK